LEENRVLPFGEPWNTTGADNEQKFTSYLRDGETGLDYAMARYFFSRTGRFLSTDPGNAGADTNVPQSWNAYAYVGNDPINFIDPSGYCTIHRLRKAKLR
jgi:RHS repeat-associated protein